MVPETLACSSKMFFAIGLVVSVRFLFAFLSFLKKTLVLYIFSRNSLMPNLYGEWSVITGATSGIGRSIAEELARRGSNVLVIGRKREVLEKLVEEIESTYKVRATFVIKDFTNDDYNEIAKIVQQLDVGILVNNVGVASSMGQGFLEQPDEAVKNMLNTNVLSCCEMTKLVLPKMINKKKGIIVNVGSASSYYPLGFHGIYPSTKCFVQFYTESLINEYPFDEFGIYFNCINPFFVATKMSKKKPGFGIPSASAYAQTAVDTFEYTGESNGCLSHHIQATLIHLMPHLLLNTLVRLVTIFARKAYIKRKQKTT